jgi:cell division protein FtsZ
MSKFREGVEVIWGVAQDSTLDSKVKITILATGFGVKDIPGMDTVLARRTQKEEEELLQIEEKREKDKQRIRDAYGASADAIGGKKVNRTRHIYIFSPEDIDNDDIIAMVEDTPTYSRTKATLKDIRNKAVDEEESFATDENTDDSGVISF